MTVAITYQDCRTVSERFFGEHDQRRSYHDSSAGQDGGAATNAIGNVGGERQSGDNSNVLNGVQ